MYARVSSDEQEKEGFSIPAQEKLLREYAREEEIEIVQEFVDVETAKSSGRREFRKMMEFLAHEAKNPQRQNRCRTILVEKTDRLYRNIPDYAQFAELDVDIHFVKENVVLTPESHSSEKLMHGIKVLLAKNNVDNLSEETKKGLNEKAEQGIWPLRAPIGYRTVIDPHGKKVIELDPEVGPNITRLFEWYATGRFSLDDLVGMARNDGLTTPRSLKPIRKSTVHKILKNRIYYGQFLWKGRIYDGLHEPLISRELWQRVQDILNDRGIRKPKRQKRTLAFSGLIRCGHCGCALVGEIQKRKYVYYHCTGHRGKCPEPYVREEVLEQKFTDILHGLAFDDEVLAWVEEALRSSHEDEKRFHHEAVHKLRKQHDQIQSRIETAYDDKLDGRISAEFFDDKVTGWREEQARIRESVERHETANQTYMDEGIALVELASRAAELFEKQPAVEKRRLLDFRCFELHVEGRRTHAGIPPGPVVFLVSRQ